MARTIKGKAGQSMYDLIAEATGSQEAGWQFCSDNGVGITDVPEVDAEYLVSDAALALGNSAILQYYAKNGTEVGTVGTEPVDGVVLQTDGGDNVVTDGDDQIIV